MPSESKRLPFTTDDVRDQCAQFGDAPLAHPLPVKDLLKMCQYIDDLEKDVERARTAWQKFEREARAEAIMHTSTGRNLEQMTRDRDHWREARRISQEYAEEFLARINAARSVPAYSMSENLIPAGTPVVLLADLDQALGTVR